jgi:hypothetical protein
MLFYVQSYPIESYADGALQDRNKQQPKQQDIDLSDVAAFLNQTGQLARAFEKNHPTPAQKALQQQQQQGTALLHDYDSVCSMQYAMRQQTVNQLNMQLL